MFVGRSLKYRKNIALNICGLQSQSSCELQHAGRNRNGDSGNTGGGGGRLLRCVSTAGTDLLERSDQAADQQTPVYSLSAAPAPALPPPRPASSTVDWTSVLQVSVATLITGRPLTDITAVPSQWEASLTPRTRGWA